MYWTTCWLMLRGASFVQVHIYLPEQDHPAHDTVRVIIKDSDDEYNGNPSRVWVDSDAFVGSNDLRNTPRNNFTDGQWHMVTVTSQPNGKKVRLLKNAKTFPLVYLWR
jgi:hypothetical protein